MSRAVHAPLGVLVLVAAGALPSAGFAQDPSTNKGGEVELAKVVARYDAGRTAVMKAMTAAETDAERMKIYAAFEPEPFVEAFFEVGVHNAGSDVAAEAFVWVVRVGKEAFVEDAREAATILTFDHIDSELLTQLIDELRYPGGLDDAFVDKTLETIRADSPVRLVQGAAQFCMAERLMRERETAEETAECTKQARALLVSLQEDYAGVGTYGASAERTLFEIDNLQIGMRAPDFETTDSDGVPFKLSDYRGKVTVVDFWGFW